MGRNYVRKREMYDTEAMKMAVQQCREGRMGYKKAAKTFKVNLYTLKDQVRGKRTKMGAGRPTVLGPEVETELADCLQILANSGLGFTRQELKELVGEYVTTKGVDHVFTDGLPGDDWMHDFEKRHPQLTCRKPEQLKKTRVKAITNREIFQDFFELFEKLCNENNIMDNPSRIYNVDESGFPLDASKSKVLCQKGVRQLFNVIGGSGREQITVNGCCCADGTMLPPYVIYAAKNLRLKWTEGGPDRTRYNVTDKGWMETDCFLDWFTNHFIPSIPPARPVLLLFDGHSSHITLKLVAAAREENVILLKLPSNSTSVLQPLDVGVYGPVKVAWDKMLLKFSRQNLGAPLTKELFPGLRTSSKD